MTITAATSSSRVRRVVFWGAVYDLVVSVPFASPFTAGATINLLSTLDETLGLSGEALTSPPPVVLLFASFFGTVVTLWSGLRVYRPTALHGAVDSVGRLFFSSWMIWSLLAGGTTMIVPFLLFEIGWLLAQTAALLSLSLSARREARAIRCSGEALHEDR